MAQDTEADDAGIGDIVVTAQKRAENIQDVPIAISAVGSEYLKTRGITSIDNLGAIAPNVRSSARLRTRRSRRSPFAGR